MAIWVALAFLLGLGVPLAVIAIYPAVIYETCTACSKRRRVEQATCEHCGADWDPLPTEGIEIVEGDSVNKAGGRGLEWETDGGFHLTFVRIAYTLWYHITLE